MEENTSKVRVIADANLATAAVLNASSSAAAPGASLFVINLCASMAPIANIGKCLPGLEAYRLYQVARREDGRTRHRLRLGFFTSEADAEAVLNSVRDSYPTAFTACLCDEDRKFARGFVPDDAMPAPKPAAKIAVVVENKPAPKAVAAKPAPAAAAKTTPPPTKAPAPQAAAPVAKTAPAAKAPTSDTVTVKALSATAKHAVANSVAPQSPEALDTTAKHRRLNPAAAKPAASIPASAAPVEIELSWDPPALQPPKNVSPTQVVAPSFKTQDVIKAPAPTPTPPKAAAVEAKKPAAAPPSAAPATTRETIVQPSKLLANIELTLESEPKVAPAKVSASPSNEPFRVGKGVDIPKTGLTLESEASVAAKPAAAPPALLRSGHLESSPAAAKPAPTPRAPEPIAAQAAPAKQPASPADTARMKAAQATAPAAIKAAVAPTAARKVDGPAPDLDSTQTIRALTSDELKDESQEKWFAIQLAVSDQPVNLDTMPRLDIFEAYRLYSVASAGSGKITHSLRIGFFREDHSAEAVCGYLKTFFNSPTVVRISIAEQARFKDAPAPKQAPKAEAKVLDLSHARERAPKVIPTVTMEVETKKIDPTATGSFKANATGTHKALNATGMHKALNATGTHKALNETGTHKALKAASKSATPPTKRSQPLTSATGKHKALPQQKRSLSQQLMDEAREVELSQSAIRKLPKNDSLFSKMFGKKK